ncbi:hypothetical protein AOZ06_01495 [Kibdelosporangium phytohabitans]|uniref:Glycosyl transferase family 28 C-terminal domain-containing protein n=1 Tax=Kibdelosporangium phytohabitans TaxID=860235 RepID=A0A0N9HSI7_9PSEU|nr:hypothetical protein AOZ06_01495 [Kibdelosporangium phytohabitans]
MAVGATAAIVEAMCPMVQRLARCRGFNLAVDPQLAACVPEAGVLFRDIPLQDLDVVVCRPGMGTLTDCVGLRLPMITLREHGNSEMDHLTTRMEQLVGAPSFDIYSDDGDSLTTMVRDMVVPHRHAAMRTALGRLKTGGIQGAADWLVRRLTKST